MTTSSVTSPNGQGQDDLYALDFLALTGMDGNGNGGEVTSPISSVNGDNKNNLFNNTNLNGNGEVVNNHFQQTQQPNLHQAWEYNPAGPSSTNRNRNTNTNREPIPNMDYQIDTPSSSTRPSPTNSRGRRSTTSKRQNGGPSSRRTSSTTTVTDTAPATGMDMEVDQFHTQSQTQVQEQGQYPLTGLGEDVLGIDIGGAGMNGNGNGNGNGFNVSDFDAVQALLQQQLQSIHMQSPLAFDMNNSQYPLAQMFLSSPSNQYASMGQTQAPEQGQGQGQEIGDLGANGQGQAAKWPNVSSSGGVFTPGPSGEMQAQPRQDLMSPMQLEMLARAHLENHNELNMLPLLSPALSQSTSNSSYTSPATHTAFPAHGGQNNFNYQHHHHSQPVTKSPIEQLQEQQRQFQEQLSLLQQQQVEMAATAAAVVAASASSNVSPYTSSSGPSSGHSRPTNTPGVTASPQYFSPLTSPALEATNRVQRHGHAHNQHYSPGFSAHQSRPPHPLSALSSPALNPVGSSGGAQQTLSPALRPVNSADMSDPDYLRALVGMLDGNVQQQHGDPSLAMYQSPLLASTSTAGHSNILASPALNSSQSTGAGPHRHALPHKTRPSPMLKPSTHRSHHRTPSSTGAFSNPTSPAVQKHQSSIPGMGYLPPSAIDHRHLQSAVSQSTASTPSPVDLSQIMPPPPVPAGSTKNKKGVTPITPASLMNLATSTDANANNRAAVPPPAQPTNRRQNSAQSASGSSTSTGRGGTKRAAALPMPSTTGNKKGGKATAATNGKRSLAIRPQGGVGVRAATKGASASAAALGAVALNGEPETRKTSHKAAEQKRRDSLKAGFDELRLLLPAINTEALDPESGEPIPGSSAPRLLPKSSLVPDDNPNRGVSKVALLKFSNEYIVILHERMDKRDDYITKLRDEIRRLRQTHNDDGEESEGEDLLDIDIAEGEEDEFGPPTAEDEDEQPEDDGGEEQDQDLEDVQEDGEEEEAEEDDMELDLDQVVQLQNGNGNRRSRGKSSTATTAMNGKRPGLLKSGSSSGNTITTKGSRRYTGEG